MRQVRLYFGRDIPGGGFVDDAAWAAFTARVLSAAFPDGFTAYQGLGQWRDPQSGRIVREKSFVVEVGGAITAAQVARVRAAYRQDFRQDSVGVVSEGVCGAF